MARITLRHQGQEIAHLELRDGREYLAGRADDAALVLPQQKGISRHHLKFSQQDGIWVVTLLARFGSLVRQGEITESLELREDCVFTTPPFEFVFVLHSDRPHAPTPATVTEEPKTNLPTILTSAPAQQQDASGISSSDTGNRFVANQEATAVVQTTELLAYLRLVSKNGNEDVLRLEGKCWTAGRDSNCEIQLGVGKISRRHFEISLVKGRYLITDLGSSNGTLLNNKRLMANHPTPLESGDAIKVSHTRIYFELRDPNFGQNMMALVPQPMSSHLDPSQRQGSPEFDSSGPAVVKIDPRQKKSLNAKNKKVLIRYAIGGLVLLALYQQLKDPTPIVDPNRSENASTTPTFEQLSPEKKQAIKNSFQLAMNMYMQTRYELCIAEIKKLHEMVPSYENSRELLTYCEHGSELMRKKEDSDRRERELAESERAIQKTIDECRNSLTEKTTMDEVRVCLASAIERAPEHPGIVELFSVVKQHEDQHQIKKQSEQAFKQRRERGRRQFEKAKELYKSGSLAMAIDEYEKFVQGDFDLSNEKSDAQRDLAQVRKELEIKVSSLIKNCQENYEKAQYKAAFDACDKALKENSKNNEAKRLKALILEDSKRELKSMYEDSVLEESMGNIDTAKQRWKQIMEKSVPGNEYHGKAKRNLQKYGAG